MTVLRYWPDDGHTSQERWNRMTASQRHSYVMRLERAVLDMGREIGTLRQQQRGVVALTDDEALVLQRMYARDPVTHASAKGRALLAKLVARVGGQ